VIDIHNVYRPFLLYFRARRLKALAAEIHDREVGSVLDVGGSALFATLLGECRMKIESLTIVNLHAPDGDLPEDVHWVQGDACHLPFPDKSYGLVICNSVIEHIPVHARISLASEIARVGRSYYVQTPNFWFPIEPHFVAPFIHWLPLLIRRRLLRRFTPWGILTCPSEHDVNNVVREINLLRSSEMHSLFPTAVHSCERWLGLCKSLIAAKLK
jgi:SAM-dependent methyltransferase